MVHPVLNVASFYVGWFACIYSATEPAQIVGPLVIAGLLAIHFCLTDERLRELRLIVLTGLFGTLLESALMVAGLYRFTNHTGSWLCPVWLTALWMAFGSTFNHSLYRLRGRYRLAVVFGALGAPLGYYAGMRLGALTFVPRLVVTLSVLAVLWAVVFPSLMWLTTRVGGR